MTFFQEILGSKNCARIKGGDRVGNLNQAGVSQDTNEIMCEVYGELPTQVLWGNTQYKHFVCEEGLCDTVRQGSNQSEL